MEWAIEASAYRRVFVDLRPAIQTLRVVLRSTGTLAVRHIFSAVMLCPPDACLALLDFYLVNHSSASAEDMSHFFNDARYTALLLHTGTVPLALLWLLGKRIWHTLVWECEGRSALSMAHRQCVQDTYVRLYETITQLSSLDQNITPQIVLLGFLDGRLPRSEDQARICNTCCQVTVQFCFAKCTSFDLIGPCGNLLESAWYQMLQTSDFLDWYQLYSAFYEIYTTTALKNTQTDPNGTVPSKYRMETYISAIQPCLFYSGHPNNVSQEFTYWIVLPYFQTLYRTGWPDVNDEETMPVIEAMRLHTLLAFKQARSMLLNGDRYEVGVWAGMLNIEQFNAAARLWRRKDILPAEDVESLLI